MGLFDRNGRGELLNIVAVIAILVEAAAAVAWINPSAIPKVDIKVDLGSDLLAPGPTLRPRITPTTYLAETDTPAPTKVPKPSSTPPPCSFADLPARHQALSDWASTLVDTAYGVGATYAPTDLMSVAAAGVGGSGSVRSFVIDDLRVLNDAAHEEGLNLVVASAWRSYKDQDALYKDIEASYGQTYAQAAAARPGHSEHQLGTSIDFSGGEAWLQATAWKYGFIESYPAAGSPDLTCYQPEPWHYRYFGRETAAAIHASGLTAREWLWAYAQ
ncbi:MAG TPA: M15 family metallopeptidase [Candidatus Limnocylindrales bacterium]